MRVALVLLVWGLWLPGSHAKATADAPEVRQLLESARYWAERQRPDLVRQLMRKLLAIQPRHPKALETLGLAANPGSPPRSGALAPANSPVPTPSTRPRTTRPAPSALALERAARTPIAQPAQAVVADVPPAAQPEAPADAGIPRVEVGEARVEEEPPARAEPDLQAVWEALDQRRAADGVRLGRALSERYPERPDVSRALALALRDAGLRGEARLGLEQAVRQSLEAPASLQWVARESRNALQALDARRQPEVATGLTWVYKPGDEAVSRLDSRVASLRVRQPWGDHGHWFGQLDSIRLEAGRADAAQLIRSGDWGSAALRQPPSPGGTPMHAHAQGRALTVGYDADRWRADIGTTPLGFEFAGLAAGLDLKGRVGSADWGVSLAHRPVTGSLLSYGGQRDLFSGIRWGAVRRTSVLLQLATTWRGLEPFAQLEWATYRGHEVLPNREQAAAIGVDWALSRGADHYLAVGPVLRLRAFDNNQNHYSVGHGGYYSPQRSTTVSVPVQAAMRGTDLSWVVRVAPSWSQSSTTSAPRFPTRADLQAQAAAQGQGTYGGSRGPGAGWALQSTWEYRMNAHWTTGFRVAAERSPDYAKEQVHLYLRWHEKPQRGPVPLWPSTVMPHAGV
jgi:hypothetical protein